MTSISIKGPQMSDGNPENQGQKKKKEKGHGVYRAGPDTLEPSAVTHYVKVQYGTLVHMFDQHQSSPVQPLV